MAEPSPIPPPKSDTHLFAALSYVWIVSVFMYVLKRSDPYVRFHSRQALVLFVLSIIFSFIPLLGWMLNVVVVFLFVIGFLRAYSGEEWRIPFIHDLAEKLKL